MKVVLQNKKTGQYFKGPAVWTDRKNEAFVFRDSAAARDFHAQHFLPDVEIVSGNPSEAKTDK